jgi:DNA-binding transcriptional ArsR family regulator
MARKSSVAAAAADRQVGGGGAVAHPHGGPDYEAPDVLLVRQPEQLKALADDLRSRIVVLLRERARSTTELADKLGHPKGTVAHHVKVLEKAGLIRVVRTRKVRAVTERHYGRTARLFLFESEVPQGAEDVRNIVAAGLRIAAEEILPSDDTDPDAVGCSGSLRVRLGHADAVRFNRRLDRLMTEFRKAEDPDGEPYGLAIALYRRKTDA